jgi:hypothetical protein
LTLSSSESREDQIGHLKDRIPRLWRPTGHGGNDVGEELGRLLEGFWNSN